VGVDQRRIQYWFRNDSSTLPLEVLRSIADIKTVEKTEEPTNKRGENLNVIRYGVASQQMMQK